MPSTMLDPVLFLFPSMTFRRAVRKALRDEFRDDEVTALLERAAAHRSALAAARKPSAIGVTFIMQYFGWAFGLYKALQEKGWTAERAGECIESIQWTIFEPVTLLQHRVSRLRSGRRMRRVQWILDLLFRTVFARPYRREVLPAKNGVAFDVVACPLATLYTEQGVPELTRFAACSLDYRMARQWGVQLTRTTTIATGHPKCDFRFTE